MVFIRNITNSDVHIGGAVKNQMSVSVQSVIDNL